MDPLLLFGAVIAIGAGAGAYALTMRDLIRRGRLHRQKERLMHPTSDLRKRPAAALTGSDAGELQR
jgi:hypothetical protein